MNFLSEFLNEDDGITAIEYAIIGVAMSAALYYILNDGGFIVALSDAWTAMEKSINKADRIL